jgi:hypothetical protein
MAAYLGQIHQAANLLYYQIRSGSAPGYPTGAVHTTAKLQALEATLQHLANGEPWLEKLVLLLGFRFALQAGVAAAVSFGASAPWSDPFLRCFDFGVMLLLFFFCLVLARLRRRARERDRQVKDLMDDYLAGRDPGAKS